MLFMLNFSILIKLILLTTFYLSYYLKYLKVENSIYILQKLVHQIDNLDLYKQTIN